MKGLIQKSGYIQPGSGGEQYVKYISHPGWCGADRVCSKRRLPGVYGRTSPFPGLFSADGTADLREMMKEISSHNAPVWTFIYSLRRGGCCPAGIRYRRELAQAAAGSPDRAGSGDEDSARGLPLVRRLP